MRPLACLRHEEPDDLGSAAEVFAAEGVPVLVVDTWREPLPTLREVSGLVVLGGDMNADDTGRFPFLASERHLLADAVGLGLPVLGICLGAQLLARALGAAVRSSPHRELGFAPINPTPEAAADPLASSFRPGDLVFQWHRDTFDVPSGATLVLQGEAVRNQGFQAGERAWGFQFHPEVTEAELDAWLASVEADLERDWGRTAGDVRAEAARHLPEQERRALELFRRFARLLR